MERFAAQALGQRGFPHWLGPINIKRFMTLRPGDRTGGELHHFAQRARYLLEGILDGGNVAGQHHGTGKAIEKPISTAPDLVAISQAIIDASLGVMVRMPMADTASCRPSFLKRSFLD